MSDEDSELIRYFENLELPQPPFRLSASEIINDLPGFIATQIRHLRSGMSAGASRTKLKQLKDRLAER
ncbi:DUF6965 family protein [Spirosoma validum]|uniref:DUF6965 domain-containing protein n=1 Tax=Spirosoma validum TaxID=2771355 RepID=A0A927B4B2_9BACT|nr:hypothetical protein [Spirosoma validum]MBD2755128.1 hypothetical protein [Spirosoma validum]